MKKLLLLFSLLVCVEAVHAQHKLILRKGWKRVLVKPNDAIGVTKNGEAFAFENWKSVCSGCFLDSCMDSLYNRRLYQDSMFFYYRDCADTNCLGNI